MIVQSKQKCQIIYYEGSTLKVNKNFLHWSVKHPDKTSSICIRRTNLSSVSSCSEPAGSSHSSVLFDLLKPADPRTEKKSVLCYADLQSNLSTSPHLRLRRLCCTSWCCEEVKPLHGGHFTSWYLEKMFSCRLCFFVFLYFLWCQLVSASWL